MNLGFRMALAAFCGCILKNLVPCIVFVTVFAANLGMASFQHEDGIVIEVAHSIQTIVAVQTSLPKLGLMFIHEIGAMGRVTGGASLRVKGMDVILVAILAAQSSSFVILGMARQAEASLDIVVKGFSIQKGGCPIFR